ncbi:MBL fold metallo-hydrolase [uncultured Litoreibacter sp.]|uniref:MBL fold metallo-hydrolase n=1 Tax=uncultured Litoreibacter sp. TaxID=1392394 RepID=UPI0026148437|nr:MBL fold metallo-hydrolase [uncultured Litoreibacter sp.]
MRMFLAIALMIPTLAVAQDRRPSHCIALADASPQMTFVHRANWQQPVVQDTVRLTYVDHAMFLIQTAGGLNAVTDYVGYTGGIDLIPDVVTMNHAHGSHWTSVPDPAIPHVLEGWKHGGAADHHLDLGEMLVRNVPTDIRSRFGGGVEKDGNSIFVFEVAGLCIGHLGHLHHEPDAAQYAALGRLDVVMAAVDGGLSLDTPTMMRVLKRLKSSVVIPMHWFGRISLNSFLAGMGDEFDVVEPDSSFIEISARSLPRRPTIMVLRPAYYNPPVE